MTPLIKLCVAVTMLAACKEQPAAERGAAPDKLERGTVRDAPRNRPLVDPDGWSVIDGSEFLRAPFSRIAEARGVAFYLTRPTVSVFKCGFDVRIATDSLESSYARADRAKFKCGSLASVLGTLTVCSNTKHDIDYLEMFTFIFADDLLIAIGQGPIEPSIEDVVERAHNGHRCR
ncbi:MAG: hypothetical protein H0T65_13035 [Deltaproteobacteria bacterium]|nr:hypothetical protein [Deltaproteobacteria bacterium]